MEKTCETCIHGGDCGDFDENAIDPACYESDDEDEEYTRRLDEEEYIESLNENAEVYYD